ncbi:hypothetical protein Tco_0971683 [Tanacetum coccineum]
MGKNDMNINLATCCIASAHRPGLIASSDESPGEERRSEDAVENPYMGTIRSKGITQLLLLGALDIIQVCALLEAPKWAGNGKKYWRKLRDHVSDIHGVDQILLMRALKVLEKLQQGTLSDQGLSPSIMQMPCS